MNNRIAKRPILSIVVPCYNEEAVINETTKRLSVVLESLINKGKVDAKSYLYFVDDGSKDKTWLLVSELSKKNNFVKGLKLAHNVGHQNALYGGLMSVRNNSDCAISIDADLQDDILVIEKFIDKYLDGYDIVYGVRSERKTDTFFKKQTALLFYKLMLGMKVEIVFNHADYRLASKRVLEALSEYHEANLFLRGIFPQLGFKSAIVTYDRKERTAGQSKYPLSKMLSFAFDGITSFSVKPLRFVSTVGFLVFLLSLVMGLYILVEAVANNKVVPGWASTVLPIYFLGGIQIFCFGIIGEYIGKIYKETKKRPRFIKETEL